MSLFRKEAITHQSERLTGTVSLAQPLSLKVTVSLLVAVATLIIVFLFNAQYSRKETVRGFLKPNKGVIKSYAQQGGIVEELFVQEGEQVNKNQLLATIIIPQKNNSGIELSSQLVAQLEQQTQLISNEITQQKLLENTEKNNLAQQLLILSAEKKSLIKQQQFSKQKLALRQNQQQQFNQLNKQGYLSTAEQQRQQQSLLDAQQAKQSIERLLLQQQNKISQIKFQQQNIVQKYALQISTLKRQQADINRQLAQTNNSYRYSIVASNAGLITGIQVVEGENVVRSKPLLHIIPKGAKLIAELLLPTRSAGFIQQGNIAKLRFDAFPYQRFGFMSSKISQIDQTLINPNKVQLPITLQEPVYRLRATLSQQQMSAYGKSFNLKSGMLFEADIMLEQRSLIQWLLEPIYSLKGRIS